MLKAFLLIVVGLAGDPEHGKTFHKWGTSLAEASERLGVPKERLVYLVDKPGEGDTRVSGTATRAEITKAIEGFGKQAGPEDVVFIMLIGHGDSDGRTAKFNLVGPDISGADFANLLRKLPTKQVVMVNAASSSGPFIEDLSGPGPHHRDRDAQRRRALHHAVRRLLHRCADVRGCRRGQEQARQRARGVQVREDRGGDARIEREGLLATEHALLDDDGDKEGSADPSATGADPKNKDGKVASVVSLGVAGDDGLPADPKLRALHQERRDLERRVESLRLLKESMNPAKYTSELENLVTAIALKTREIRAAEGK